MQFEGVVFPRSGTIATFWPSTSSVFRPESYYDVSAPLPSTTVVATAAHLSDPDSVGSNVFYLGGHDYTSGTTIDYINGSRMYLNAALVPTQANVIPNCTTGQFYYLRRTNYHSRSVS